MELVGELDFECLRIDLHSRTLAPFKESAQAFCKLGVAEPQSDPQGVSPYVPVTRMGPYSPWNPGRYLSMGSGLPRKLLAAVVGRLHPLRAYQHRLPSA